MDRADRSTGHDGRIQDEVGIMHDALMASIEIPPLPPIAMIPTS